MAFEGAQMVPVYDMNKLMAMASWVVELAGCG